MSQDDESAEKGKGDLLTMKESASLVRWLTSAENEGDNGGPCYHNRHRREAAMTRKECLMYSIKRKSKIRIARKRKAVAISRPASHGLSGP